MGKKNGHTVTKIETYHGFAVAETDSFCESYNGLPIHALDGLHGFIAEKAVHFLGTGENMLDLGAGSGAMCQRLLDLGFKLTAMDLVAENFRLKKDVPFITADLNEDFSDMVDGRFGGIIAVEIIEHIENPRKFLRECFKLLKTGGYLILSTPNIDNPVSKMMFLKSGVFQWFTDYNYDKDGHIMPVSQWLLRKISQEAGFSTVWIGTFGDPLKGVSGVARNALARMIQMISSCKSDMDGEITVAVLKK